MGMNVSVKESFRTLFNLSKNAPQEMMHLIHEYLPAAPAYRKVENKLFII